MGSPENKSIIWDIDPSGVLILVEEGVRKAVTASEVIKFEFGGILTEKPSTFIQNLKFSKTPLSCKLIILTSKTEESINVFGEIYLTNMLGNVTTSIGKLSQDYVIIDNNWYPLIYEDFRDINEIINECGIDDIDHISLRSYLSLLRLKGHDDVLEFKVTDINTHLPKASSDYELVNFNATLYDYQSTGFKWLSRISSEDFGCILADEMGLGKTIQVIALIHSQLETPDYPSLVICPSSLIVNWIREFQKFSPNIRTYLHAGFNRTGFADVLRSFDVIITSYDIAVRDFSLFESINFNFLICDEAQAMKNPLAKRTKYIKNFVSRVTIAVTGTPFENKLSDVWSLTDLIAPGLLGELDTFLEEYPNNTESGRMLEPIISPIILRRRVKDVATDLPKRIDIPQPIQMDERLAGYYNELRTDIINRYGNKATFASIQTLRMFCCDPSMALKDGIDYEELNTKFQRLMEIVFEIFLNGEKALIFSSYLNVSDKIVKSIRENYNCYVKNIDGRIVSDTRQEIIDEFSSIIGPGFLVLNPKAAGTGLNITSANHVIHFNLEWNPSVEDQATARAYRRGQTKPVFIHRLFYSDTIEEYIDKKIETKREISRKTIIGTDGEDGQIDDIFDSLMYFPKKEMKNDN